MAFKQLLAGLMFRRLRTARDVVRFAFRFYGQRVAIIDRRGALTYSDIAQRSLQLSAAMEAGGVKKGDIVFTWLPETGEQFELRLATFENGAILAMFHQALTPEAALQAIRTLKPGLFFHDIDLSHSMIDAAKVEFPGMQCIALGVEYENYLAAHPARRSLTVLEPRDYASLHLTSGTTGQPKAIGVTHGKYLLQLRMMASDLKGTGASRKSAGADVLLLGMPLTGPGGGFVLPSLLSGATLVVPTDYSVPQLTSLIRRWRVTRAFISPSTLIDLLDDPQRKLYDLSSLRNVIYGSEMTSAAKLAEAVRWLGPIFQQGYGSFEAMPPLTWLRALDHVDADGAPASQEILSSVGTVARGVGIHVVNNEKRKLHDGNIGQIVVKTPLAFSGYWDKAELNDATLYRGWVLTGDMGYFDAHKRLHVLGRRADTVRRGAQEIYPRQVEEVAHAQACVRDACLVQVRDEAHLVVTLRHAWRKAPDLAAMAQEIASYLLAHLAPELQPDRIHIVESIPRSFLNKMLRREVREQLLKSTQEMAPASNVLVSNTSTQKRVLEAA